MQRGSRAVGDRSGGKTRPVVSADGGQTRLPAGPSRSKSPGAPADRRMTRDPTVTASELEYRDGGMAGTSGLIRDQINRQKGVITSGHPLPNSTAGRTMNEIMHDTLRTSPASVERRRRIIRAASAPSRTANPQWAVAKHSDASSERIEIGGRNDSVQRMPNRRGRLIIDSKHQDPSVAARRISLDISEAAVECDDKSLLVGCRTRDRWVVAASESFRPQRCPHRGLPRRRSWRRSRAGSRRA